MWLVMCSSADASALWAYQGLKQLGLAPLELVTAESLACASRWEHRVRSRNTEIRITLANGLVIDGSRVRGVLNRLYAPPDAALQYAAPSDRPYAQAEMLAFYLSWLHGMPGVVINRPTPIGLNGPWLHSSEWAIRAGRAGLKMPTYRQSARDDHRQDEIAASEKPARHSVIAMREEVFGAAVPEGVAKACRRLVSDAGTQMLGIELSEDSRGEWQFSNAVSSPDLRRGGVAMLQSLAQILVQGSAKGARS
jgi:hypothetical protein